MNPDYTLVKKTVQSNNEPEQRNIRSKVRKIKHTSFCPSKDTIKTVMTVVFVIFIVFGVLITPVQGAKVKSYEATFPPNQKATLSAKKTCPNPIKFEPTPSFFQPFNSRPKPLFTHSKCSKPIKEFHSSNTKLIHPGAMSDKKGRLCAIPDANAKMPSFEECEKVAEFFDKVAQNHPQIDYKTLISNPVIQAEKGHDIHYGVKGSNIKLVKIGMNPQKVVNYQKALAYVEKEVLQNPNFFFQQESKILACIKNTNKLAGGKISPQAGQLRTEFALILDDDTDGISGMFELLEKKGASEAEINTLTKFFQREQSTGKASDTITPEELRVLKRVGYVPTLPKNLKIEFSAFVKELKILGQQVQLLNIDPINAAAHVHQRIGEVHAFRDANGRTARIWMNVMLQLGGEKAIVFPSDSEYTAAIIADQTFPGSFTDYLEEVIEWNRKQTPLHTV